MGALPRVMPWALTRPAVLALVRLSLLALAQHWQLALALMLGSRSLKRLNCCRRQLESSRRLHRRRRSAKRS